jgi:hypothetical protein
MPFGRSCETPFWCQSRANEFVDHSGRTIRSMTLKQSNPHLRLAAARKAALRVSAQSSSAVEGIRAPFAKGAGTNAPASTEAFIAQWMRRASATAR